MRYDDQYQQNNTDQKKYKSKSWIVPSILGMVIGVILFAAVLPSLIRYDILPYQIMLPESAHQQDHTTSDDNVSSIVKPMSVDISTQITEIVKKVAPTVVGIENIQSASIFTEEAGKESGTGSGVIYKLQGDKAFVVTNYHVVDGADQIEVILSDDSRLPAKLRGSDLFMDLAVLEMDRDAIEHVAALGDSDHVKVGEPAIAIGNPLGLDLSGSVTQGIISGKRRAIPQDFNGDGRADWQAEVIQTDAAINPGNSGGALINMDGQLIGINSMKIAQSSVEGIGFSIPINDAIPVIEELEKNGQMSRAFLGVEAYSLEDVAQVEWTRSLSLPTDVTSGIYLQSVEPRSPASEAGLATYDVIIALDGEPIKNIIDLRKHLYQKKKPGDQMVVTFYRDGNKQKVTVTLTAQEQ
ncbi:S1C family serine protease [Paraliobacillus sp. JSM ZJ581]|uniref:S1C family serine protease n=1 Tax=Paraliobacillus sp. JSM ZJ581 TaxID=3342118 RepID=UPI0035A9660C